MHAVVLLAALAAAPSAADEPKPTPKGEAAAAAAPVDEGPSPQETQAKRDALRVFVGKWKCEGGLDQPTQQRAPFSATMKVEPVLGGAWLRVVMETTKPKDGPAFEELWGWDVEQQGYRRLSAAKRGASVVGTSDGWLGDRFAWSAEGTNAGKPWRGKTTWTKKSDRELELEGANAFGGGELTVVMEAVCRR